MYETPYAINEPTMPLVFCMANIHMKGFWISSARYHEQSCTASPGNMPASIIPKKKRAAYKPSLFLTAAWQASTAPQDTMMRVCQLRGLVFFNSKLLGISNRM